MLNEKDRIDVVLVNKKYFQTRQKAKYEIEKYSKKIINSMTCAIEFIITSTISRLKRKLQSLILR